MNSLWSYKHPNMKRSIQEGMEEAGWTEIIQTIKEKGLSPFLIFVTFDDKAQICKRCEMLLDRGGLGSFNLRSIIIRETQASTRDFGLVWVSLEGRSTGVESEQEIVSSSMLVLLLELFGGLDGEDRDVIEWRPNTCKFIEFGEENDDEDEDQDDEITMENEDGEELGPIFVGILKIPMDKTRKRRRSDAPSPTGDKVVLFRPD